MKIKIWKKNGFKILGFEDSSKYTIRFGSDKKYCIETPPTGEAINIEIDKRGCYKVRQK